MIRLWRSTTLEPKGWAFLAGQLTGLVSGLASIDRCMRGMLFTRFLCSNEKPLEDVSLDLPRKQWHGM